MIIFVKLWVFEEYQFGTINARYISRSQRVSGYLICLRNILKLVERILFAIISLLPGAKGITLYLICLVGRCDVHKKSEVKKILSIFVAFHFIMLLRLHRPLKAVGTFKDSP